MEDELTNLNSVDEEEEMFCEDTLVVDRIPVLTSGTMFNR